MLDQRALDLERADQVAGALDQVVCPAHEPVVAVAIAHRQIAGQIPSSGEALRIARGFAQIVPHHRRPAGPQR
jgi:hypothetical protein